MNVSGNGSRPRFLILAALVFTTVCADLSAAPQPAESARQEYFRLRNTDPAGKLAGEWKRVAKRLDSALQTARGHDREAHLFSAGMAYERLYYSEDEIEYLEEAVARFRNLRSEFPDSSLRVEAIIREGDLLNALGDKKAADNVYRLVPGNEAAARRIQDRRLIRDRFTMSSRLQPPFVTKLGALAHAEQIVVLDPGHGGEDFGGSGVGGLFEKEITLDIARAVRNALNRQGIKVVLTREGDYFMPLSQRTQVANASDATIFVSIHTNASPSHALSGVETYYLDNTDDQGSKKLAERENGVLFRSQDNDLDFIVSDLVQSGKIEDSIALGRAIQGRLVQDVATPSGLRDLGVKRGPFYVLVGAHMPCVLAELFFLDNVQDGKLLGRSGFREKVSAALARGIIDYSRGTIAARSRKVVSVPKESTRVTKKNTGIAKKAKARPSEKKKKSKGKKK